MNNKIAVISLIVALLALVAGFVRPGGNAGTEIAKKETVFERVMRTHTIRCGYAVWNPVLYKDVETDKVRGIAHDVMEALGKKLDLRIEWAEETGWSTLVEGLATGRYDMICNALGVVPPRAKAIDFSAPLFYVPSYIVVRADEKRLAHNDDMNDPAYSFSVLEGEASSFLIPKKFPKAQEKQLPQNTDFALVFQDVETRKADATIVSRSDFVEYEKTNPGKLRILDMHPVDVYAAAFGLPQGDVAMKTMINTALTALFIDGTIGEAVRAYAASPDEFFAPVTPYKIPADAAPEKGNE